MGLKPETHMHTHTHIQTPSMGFWRNETKPHWWEGRGPTATWELAGGQW